MTSLKEVDSGEQCAHRHLSNTLWPHQNSNLRRMLENELIGKCGGILADDTGLGKSAVIVALVCSRRHFGNTLIVTLPMVVGHWMAEFKRLAPHVNVRTQWSKCSSPAVVVTTYTRLKKCTEMFNGWSRVVLDEAHLIRDPRSKRFEYANRAGGEETLRWAVTGTPFQKDTTDIRVLAKYAKIDSTISIPEVVKHYMIRHKHKEVMNDIPKEWRFSYPIVETRYIEPEEGFAESDSRKVCSGLQGKVADCVKVVAELEHHVVVFSQYENTIRKVASAVPTGKSSYTVNGRQSVSRRNTIISNWKRHPTPSILFASMRTMGLGVDLSCAKWVILMEPDWNPFTEYQMISRVARPGVKTEVVALKYVVKGSVEERMVETQRTKNEVWGLLD